MASPDVLEQVVLARERARAQLARDVTGRAMLRDDVAREVLLSHKLPLAQGALDGGVLHQPVRQVVLFLLEASPAGLAHKPRPVKDWVGILVAHEAAVVARHKGAIFQIAVVLDLFFDNN